MKIKIATTIISLSLISINASIFLVTLSDKHYKNSINIENYTEATPDIPTISCDLPLVLNNSNDSCIDTFDKIDWIETSDSCQGIRQSTMNANIYYLRSNTRIINTDPQVPEGYHWMTTSEYNSYASVNTNSDYAYANQCGLSSYPIINGETQQKITFSDSTATGFIIHAGNWERVIGTWDIPDTNWLGIVVYKDF